MLKRNNLLSSFLLRSTLMMTLTLWSITVSAFVCGDITSVSFSNGTQINDGDVFLLTNLPSSVTINATITGTPGLIQFAISGPVNDNNIQIFPPYNSSSFTPIAGYYTVVIKVYDNFFDGGGLCEELEIQFTIKEDLAPEFTEDAVDWGIDIDNGKDGGLAFGDYDNDGDLDLLVNTDDNTNRSRLHRNNGDYTFTDVTASLAPYMLTTTRERAALWGDLNNDGYLDFLRNTSTAGIEVYIQDPGSGRFGNGTGGTTPLIFNSGNISNGVNTEGVGMVDFDGDGDLDIIFDNHNFGVDILRNNYVNHTNGSIVNPASSGLFTHATPGTSTILGLSQSATDGDYGSFTDVNDDGWVDIFMRKRDENDFFLNQGGTFTNGSDLAQANNNNKGAVNLYDYDNDGDFDAFWTEEGDNQIFRNDNGVWIPLGASTGIPTDFGGGDNIDEVASGDIDNDGDIDILLVGDRRSYLYINQLNDQVYGKNYGAPMTFVLVPDLEFHPNKDGEGAVMVDIDNDGDLDIYINVENSANQLFINERYDASTPEVSKNYLFVKVIDDRSEYMQAGQERMALGATVVLEDCSGNVISGLRELNGGNGHGTQDPPIVHFGLPDGPDYSYRVVVKYPNWINASGQTVRREVAKWIRPSQETTFPITIEFRPSDADIYCPQEICGNGIDDDFDFLTDCEDPDCEGDIDVDNDGIATYCDLDDDNDGILDTDEGYCDDYLTMIRWTHNPGDPDPGDPDGHRKAWFDPNIVRIGRDERAGSGVSLSNPGTSHVVVNGTEATSLNEAILRNEYIEYRFTTATDFNDRVYHFDALGVYNAMGIYGSNVTYGVAYSTDNFTTSTIIRRDAPHNAVDNFTFDYQQLAFLNRVQLLENTAYSFRVYFYDLNGNTVHSFDDFSIYVCSSGDYDRDGIANFEDLDSDGDECWDASESGHEQDVDDNGYIATTFVEVGDNGLDNDVESDDTPAASVTYTISSTAGQFDFVNELINSCAVCQTANTNPHIMYYRKR